MLKIQTGTRTIYKEKRKTNERTNEQKKKKTYINISTNMIHTGYTIEQKLIKISVWLKYLVAIKYSLV